MSDVLKEFVEKKEADSQFLSLPESGDSVTVQELKNIEIVNKNNFNGEPTDFIRLTILVDTVEGPREKIFDNSSKSFADTLRKSKVNVGTSFRMIRDGLGKDTRYIITDVANVKPTDAPEPKTEVDEDEISVEDIPF